MKNLMIFGLSMLGMHFCTYASQESDIPGRAPTQDKVEISRMYAGYGLAAVASCLLLRKGLGHYKKVRGNTSSLSIPKMSSGLKKFDPDSPFGPKPYA